jgi:small subunit ribosomal protein S23
MGRYDFRPHRVLRTADQLLETKRIQHLPCWYKIVQDVPPSAILTRPVHRDASWSGGKQSSRKGRKPSKMFQPLAIPYPEDKLRKDFFGDHPWELARPKVVLEDGGDERKGWDWSTGIRQPGKRIDGERFVSACCILIYLQFTDLGNQRRTTATIPHAEPRL